MKSEMDCLKVYITPNFNFLSFLFQKKILLEFKSREPSVFFNLLEIHKMASSSFLVQFSKRTSIDFSTLFKFKQKHSRDGRKRVFEIPPASWGTLLLWKDVFKHRGPPGNFLLQDPQFRSPPPQENFPLFPNPKNSRLFFLPPRNF